MNPYTDQIFIQNSPKENKQFIGFQLFLDMIFRLDQIEYAKQELLQFSRSKCQHDSIQLKKLMILKKIINPKMLLNGIQKIVFYINY